MKTMLALPTAPGAVEMKTMQAGSERRAASATKRRQARAWRRGTSTLCA
jgi:hypothetical protein